MRTKYVWVLALSAALPAAACNCNTKTVVTAAHLTVLEGSSADFGQICLDGTQNVVLTVRNNGNTPANIEWTVEPVGNDSVAAKMFTTDPPVGTAKSLSGNGSFKITVTYHPTDDAAGGDSQLNKLHSAFLHFTSNSSDPASKVFEVKLDGRTSDLQPVAIGSFSCSDGDTACGGADTTACCLDVDPEPGNVPPELGRKHLNRIDFGATPTGASRSQKFDIANIGCGTLNVSGALFVSDGGSFCPQSSITVTGLDKALSLPGSVTGTGAPKTTITVTFSPADQCTLSGKLVLTTDDPNIDPTNSSTDYASVNILGSGAQPEVTALCNNLLNQCIFGEVATGTCGVPETELHLANHGNFPVTVTQVDIKPGGAGTPDFTVDKIETVNCDDPTLRTVVTVPFTLAPSDGKGSCGPDEVFVSLAYCPGKNPDNTRIPDDDTLAVTYTEEGGGGEVNIHLHGGSDPIMEVHPDNASVPGTLGCIDDSTPPNFAPAALVFQVPNTLSCTSCDETCHGSCTTDDDCTEGNGPCAFSSGVGVCAGSEACITGVCTGNVGSKPVKICNVGKGDLQVSSIQVVDPDGAPNSSFEVHNETDCTGTVMHQNECCNFFVLAKADNTGGVKHGSVIIKSNDPQYKTDPPAVDVCSKVPLHVAPQSRIDVTDGAGGTDVTAPSWVYLDPSPTITVGTTENWKWTLVKRASGSHLPDRPNDAAGMGIIDQTAPDAHCPPSIPGGCFQFPGSPEGKVLAFYAEVSGDYVFHVTLDDGVCSPPLQNDPREETPIHVH